MLISIIITTFNADLYLERCLSSIVKQNVDYELIVIDAGSTDRTHSIINSYINYVNKFLIVKGIGIYEGLNLGILNSSGDYLYIMGSDDELIDSNSLRYLSGSSDYDLIYGDYFRRNKNYLKYIKADSLKYFKYKMPFSHQSVIIRSSIMKNNLFQNQLASDYYLLYKCYLNKYKFKYINRPIVNYSMGGVSDRKSLLSTIDRLRINFRFRGLRAIDVLPYYAASILKSLLELKF